MGALSPVSALVSTSGCDFVPKSFPERSGIAGVGVWTAGTGAGLKESGTWLFFLLWWCWVHSYELSFPPCQGWCKTLPEVLGCRSSGLSFPSARSPTPGLDPQVGLRRQWLRSTLSQHAGSSAQALGSTAAPAGPLGEQWPP